MDGAELRGLLAELGVPVSRRDEAIAERLANHSGVVAEQVAVWLRQAAAAPQPCPMCRTARLL